MIIESENIVKSPAISVIVITYNQEKYIAQCLDSILSQRVNVPYELIIAEDGGFDNTRAICIQYQKAHPEVIRLLLQEHNKGISGNYADVLALTRADYIAQIGGDDFWCNENKLQLQYDYMTSHPQCGLCYTNVKSCDENGCIIVEDYLEGIKLSQSFEDHIVNPCFIAPLTWMYTRKVMERFQDRGYADESVAMALEAFANYEVHRIEKCTAVYRQTPNSASAFINPTNGFRQYVGVLDTQLYFAEKYKISSELKNKMLLRNYLTILPIAVMAHEDDYVEKIREYMESQGLGIELIIRELKAGEQRKHSRAYKLGKKILRLFRWMKELKS